MTGPRARRSNQGDDGSESSGGSAATGGESAAAGASDAFSAMMDQLKAAAEYFTEMGTNALSAVPSAVSAAEGRIIPTMASIPQLPAMPPMPGSLTAAQFEVAMATLKAQRASVSALKDQLTAFDNQLGVLEDLLSPMASWAKSWARAESSVTSSVTPPRGNRKS